MKSCEPPLINLEGAGADELPEEAVQLEENKNPPGRQSNKFEPQFNIVRGIDDDGDPYSMSSAAASSAGLLFPVGEEKDKDKAHLREQPWLVVGCLGFNQDPDTEIQFLARVKVRLSTT